MRILLDECLPRDLRKLLPGHNVRTVQELGWTGKKNGEQIRLISIRGFDVFLTVDGSIQFQQDLASTHCGFIVLSAPSNRMEDLTPLVPEVTVALTTIKPGDVVRITA
jgi:hypothetical protein